ncbi:MAG TPA: cell surface protein SprA [Candidatus Latescibacteria bacterium]|nr:cell surface protein SprA [Candidatus Latescibacterota bacterium]
MHMNFGLLLLMALGFPALSYGEAFLGIAREDAEGLWRLVSSFFLPLLREEKGFCELEVVPDFERKVVRVSRRQDDLWSPVEVELDVYLEAQFRHVLRREWYNYRDRVPKGNPEKRGRDLEIELPVRFPKVVERFLGQGSRISVTGVQKISFGGRSEWTEGEVATATHRPSKFPSLTMEQNYRFTVKGTVGERVHIQMDRDSQRMTEWENTLKLWYDGDEDRIVQKVEAGNTALSLPGTYFAGVSAQHKGLFGVRAQGKLGPVDFTIIASQEKGATASKTFRGMAEKGKVQIRDYEYEENLYFFLDDRYQERWQTLRRPGNVVGYNPADSVVALTVYLDDGDPTNNEIARTGWAFYDPDRPDSTKPGYGERGYFHPLDPTEYFVDRALGYIVLKRSVRSDQVLAVVFRTAGGELVGDDSDEELRLKLIKPRNSRPDYPTWNYIWRNVYYLGTKGINRDGFELRILKEVPGGQPQEAEDGVPYVRLLGLDRHGEEGLDTPPDGLVDPEYIDFERGELIFPDLRPFDSDSNRIAERLPQLYNSRDSRTRMEASKYFLEVSYQNRKTKFNLGPNVLEGTEVVRLNGVPLKKGVDYEINYSTGEIVFTGAADEVSSPSSDLEIRYQYAPFFSLQQKHLLGLRGEYRFWGERGLLGMSLLYRGERKPERRVKVGSEPSRNLLWDVNANVRWEPGWLSALGGWLSRGKGRSQVKLSAEVARSFPNPNTRGIGYIDDFEGIRESTSLGVGRGIWTLASGPVGRGEEYRGRLIWYNPYDRVRITDIWPNRRVSPMEDRTNVLVLEFTPREGNPASWGGVMRALPGGGEDFSRREFLEIWVRGGEGILHVDLGAISEDVIPNGRLDTEDKERNGIRNRILDLDEDIGMDGMAGPDPPESEWPDPQEPAHVVIEDGIPHGVPYDFWDLDGNGVRDPGEPASWDDWKYRGPRDYSRINGTEGNKDDPDRLGQPDTEDINRNGYLDEWNDYYAYAIDLSDDVYEVEGTEHNGWRLLRIPLWEGADREGKPDSTRVEFARIWIDGVMGLAKVEIAQIEVVGNRWLKLPGEGEVRVSVKNTDENEDYRSPPGLPVEVDQITGVPKREQSLVLQFQKLPPGGRMGVYRVLRGAEDYTGYRTMKLWVYGGEEVSEGDSLAAFLRFGADSSNYYEAQLPIAPGWRELRVPLEDLTQLKYQALQDTLSFLFRDALGVRGTPSLSSVRWMSLGVYNFGGQAFSGEVWFDELRLDDVRREPGTALRASLQAGVGEVLRVQGEYTGRGEDFRGFGEKGPGGSEDRSYSLRWDLQLGKLFPEGWGVSLPIGITLRERVRLPKFQPGSDIVLPEEGRRREQSYNRGRTVNLSFQMRPRKAPTLLALTLGKVHIRASYSRTQGRSPQRPLDRRLSYYGSLKYELTPGRRGFQPLKWLGMRTSVYYLPTKISAELRMRRQEQEYFAASARDTTQKATFDLEEGYQARLRPLESLELGYRFGRKWDLGEGDLWRGKFGLEIERSQSASLRWNPKALRWLSQRYDYEVSYSERLDPRYRKEKGRDLSRELRLSAHWSLEVPSLLRPLSPRLAGALGKVTGTLSHTLRASLPGVVGRPSLGYQLGFRGRTKDLARVKTSSRRESRSSLDRIELSTTLQLPLRISAKPKYRMERKLEESASSTIKTWSWTAPGLSLQWNGMPLFGGALRSSGISLSYERKVSRREAAEGPLSRSYGHLFRPLLSWNAQWKSGMQTTLRLNVKHFREEDRRTDRATEEREEELRLSGRYRLEPKGRVRILPWKELKLRSYIDLSLEVNYRHTYRGVGPVPRRDEVSWSVSPEASYRFSRKITGGAKVEVGDRKDRILGTTRKVREVRIWAEIRLD